MNLDREPRTLCHVCGEFTPYDMAESAPFVEGDKRRHHNLCQSCAEKGCPLCAEELIDGTPLVMEQTPERRACHADCVVSARRQAEEDR